MSLELQSLLPYPNSCLGASPHQQGRDTKMEMLSFGGIDVSKDRLDITVLPDEQCSSVSNDAAGWAELIEQLRGSLITAIGVEASGGYERGVVRALLAAGMSVRQINPYKLRQFAKASGILAKNDRLDARMIASFVAIMPTRPAQRQTPMIEQRCLLSGVSSVITKSPPRMRPDCWRMRCCNVFLAAASLGLPPTSTCSTSAWSRSLLPILLSPIVSGCSPPCRGSAPCWLAR